MSEEVVGQDENQKEEEEEATVSSPSSVVPLNDGVEGDHQHCLVCYSTLDHPGILPCDHNEICGVCHLRLRHLHGNNKCPICKMDNEKIIVDTPGTRFDEYPMWGDDLGNNYIFRQDVGMFFPTEYYGTVIEPLFGYHCTQDGCQFDGTVPEATMYEQMQEEQQQEDGNVNSNNNNQKNKQNNNKKNKKPPTPLRALQDHLRNKHRLTLCQLCIDHKRDFVALLPRMAPYELKRHQTKGDGPGSGFEGHPVCEFCRPKRFYDLAHLHMHLRKDHYKCHVCENRGFQNQFFRNYQNLEKHFDREHFLCQDAQCIQARFVVFENEIDLHAHERQVHGMATSGSSKINVEFRTRRAGYDGSGVERQQEVPSEEDFNYGLQGEAFVPQALPQNSDLTLHPLHMQRTAEFRAQAAQMREQQEREMQGAAFPSLQEAAAGEGGNNEGVPGQRLNVGWTSQDTMHRVAAKKKNAGAVTEEDFPSLPGSGAPRRPADNKLRAGANRQFAAMTSAARQPVRTAPASNGWAGSAAAVAAQPAASYQHNNAAFPPTHAAAAPRNREEDLNPENFPALGGGTKKTPKYTTATNLTRKYQEQQQAPPSWNSAIDFPAPLNSKSSSKKPAFATQRQAAPPAQRPPSFNSEMDFPPPPSASSTNNSTKQKVLGPQRKQPSQAARANMLEVPQSSLLTSANPQDTLRDMQASLGPAKYKKLKKCTREFAEDQLAPDAFIDHAAALFDRGYGDPDFWKCIPALVSSCPNQGSANEALRYMESLRAPNKNAPAPTPSLASAPTPPSNNWGSTPLNLTPSSFPTPPTAPASMGSSKVGANNFRVNPRVAAAPTTRYVVPGAKKNNAWGSGAPAQKVMQAAKQTTPGISVAAAAARQGPQDGASTKLVDKQMKQQQQQELQKQLQSNTQNNQGKKKNNKKKERDELKKLAFGR